MSKKLSELCDVIVPMRDKPKEFVSKENGIPWCKIEDIEGKFLNNSLSGKYVTNSCVEKMNLRIFPKGTVLCAVTGASIGTYAITTTDLVTNQTFAGLFCKEQELYNEFLYYYLQLHTNMFINNSVGCAQAYITRETLENMKMPDFTYNEQHKIVDVLKLIDDKIENNNKINAELESMAKTIYDYWFLQFEFPNEDGKPYKSSGGKMVWNEELKREIPEGWEVKNVLSLCDVIDCLHSKKPDFKYEDELSFMLTLENLTRDGRIDISNKYYISKKDYENWISRIEVCENDFVVTNAGRAGDICKIPAEINCAIGRNITAIRPKKINPYYLDCFFKSNYVKEQIESNLDSGSFFMSYNVKSIKKLNILLPDDKTLNEAVNKVRPMIKQIENNIKENQELASLRDFLLPMLMNGQVGFKDGEK